MQNKECKKIAIASDHIGIELKKIFKQYLLAQEIKCIDLGTNTSDRVDYPDYALQVSRYVVEQKADRGVLICGTGVGMSIAANKVCGIRCVVCSDTYSAVLSRQHNNTNVLAVGVRVIGVDLALKILDEWVHARYEGERHQQRIDKITQMES